MRPKRGNRQEEFPHSVRGLVYSRRIRHQPFFAGTNQKPCLSCQRHLRFLEKLACERGKGEVVSSSTALCSALYLHLAVGCISGAGLGRCILGATLMGHSDDESVHHIISESDSLSWSS